MDVEILEGEIIISPSVHSSIKKNIKVQGEFMFIFNNSESNVSIECYEGDNPRYFKESKKVSKKMGFKKGKNSLDSINNLYGNL